MEATSSQKEMKYIYVSLKKVLKDFETEYLLGDDTLRKVDEVTYLGIKITSNLSWTRHIQDIASKANRIMGLIKRTLHGCDPHIKEHAYKSLVRPQMEYATSIWDPSTAASIHILEMVQKRSARFVSGLPLFTRDDISVTQLVKNLKWPTLATRRKQRRLLLFHSIVHGYSAGLRPLQERLVLTPRCTTLRGNHTFWFNPLSAKSNVKRDSFLNRTLKDWNSLPGNAVALNRKDYTIFLKSDI